MYWEKSLWKVLLKKGAIQADSLGLQFGPIHFKAQAEELFGSLPLLKGVNTFL